MPEIGRFHSHLKAHRASQTPERDSIFNALWKLGPCTKEEITTSLKEKIGQNTVYRNLRIFRNIGIIEEAYPGHFELTNRFKQHHHYFHCRECDQRTTFNDEKLEKALGHLTASRNLALEDHKIELTGLCSKCRLTTKAKTPIGTSLRSPPA